jgi:hypothetical protein
MIMAESGPSAAGADPGLHGPQPSERELAEEERIRSDLSVADLVEQDLDDPTTPSRRSADGNQPEPGSFDVPLRERTGGLIDGG